MNRTIHYHSQVLGGISSKAEYSMGTFIQLDFTSIELKLIAGKHAQGLAIANNLIENSIFEDRK